MRKVDLSLCHCLYPCQQYIWEILIKLKVGGKDAINGQVFSDFNVCTPCLHTSFTNMQIGDKGTINGWL